MGICPKCGNQIQPWAHGACYTCRRIKRDHKRYGRRRPVTLPKPTESIPSSSRLLKCYICKRVVRSDRLGSHRWHAHGIRPYSSDKPIPLGAPADMPAQPKSKLTTCPYCKYQIPAENYPGHVKHHEQARQRSRRRTVKFKKIPASPVRQRSPVSQVANMMLKGTNRFLFDLYEQPTLLSDILRAGGFTEDEMRTLRRRHLSNFMNRLTARWRTWWKSILPPHNVIVLVEYYGFGRQPPHSLASIAARINLSYFDSWDILMISLANLRSHRRQQNLERLVREVARQILGNAGSSYATRGNL